MSSQFTAGRVFLITFGLAFLFSFIVGLSVTLPFGWLLSLFGINVTQVLLIIDAAVSLIVALIIGVLGLILFYVWRATPRGVQIVLIVVLFVVAIALVQPEIAVLPLIGAILTFGGVNNTRALK